MEKELVDEKRDPNTNLVEHDMVSGYFSDYGDTATAGGSIVGTLLKFSKGDWLLGQDEEEVPAGTKYAALMDRLTIGWVRWEDNKPKEYHMGKLIEGYQPPRRKDLGSTDESEWEVDDQGSPRDPWQFSNNLVMRPPGTTGEDDDDLVTYATSSRGGIGAVGELCKVYGRGMRTYRHDWPVVEIGVSSYKHSNKEFGRIKVPVLKVVGWEPKVPEKSKAPEKPKTADPVAAAPTKAEAPKKATAGRK